MPRGVDAVPSVTSEVEMGFPHPLQGEARDLGASSSLLRALGPWLLETRVGIVGDEGRA